MNQFIGQKKKVKNETAKHSKTNSSTKSIEQLRKERLEREQIEKEKLANILYGEKKSVDPKTSEKERPYNSSFQNYSGAKPRGKFV